MLLLNIVKILSHTVEKVLAIPPSNKTDKTRLILCKLVRIQYPKLGWL